MDHENGNTSVDNVCGTFQSIWADYSDRLDRNVYIINATFSVIFCFPTVAINLILFIAVWRTSTLRTPSNILICVLAITDLCVGIVEMIFAGLLFSMITNAIQTIKCVLAVLSRLLANMFAEMSFLTFTAISVDKLLMVHFHLRYNTLVTIPKILIAVTVISCLCGGIAALNFISIKLYTAFIAVITCTCFIVAFISYSKIYRTVIRHQQEIHEQTMAVATRGGNNKVLELARFKKRTFSMMCIYCIFLLFYFPYILIIIIMMTLKQENTTLAAAKIYSITFIFLNSFVNPLLICSTMREIRKAMRHMLSITKQKKNGT
ncbi:melanocyte-stimulating hormone receptor-like [Actinia tenebrosa]|uniref:Melanocyte-stimulating hormone receptor-like n=1 Tax=Actinia tenebrosa TaxID=6105 RepID=A0A6P8H978_ACTTE|nr:melanocyte-stimulating hormone receptor-like [Actinia tenebrosa]